MTEPRTTPPATERYAVATLDHHLGALGYAAVPDHRPASGGWRRIYMGEGRAPILSVVGPSQGSWCSIGIEFSARRARAAGRADELLAALAPYEVALDLDASEGHAGADVVVRVALRVFVEALSGAVVRDVVDNVAEAAVVTRLALGEGAA